jgi:hydroxymethylglutaryl-CoA reductase
MNNPVAGFSKLSKEEKINWCQRILFSSESIIEQWKTMEFWWKTTKLHDEFIENTITNFETPLSSA